MLELWSQGSFPWQTRWFANLGLVCGAVPGPWASLHPGVEKSKENWFTCSVKIPGQESHVLFLLTYCFLTHGMLGHKGLGNVASSWTVLGVITHTLQVWKSENIWWTAAISSILGVTLFGKIVSIY